MMPSREHLEDFLAVVDRRSVQAAARATGRSRATVARRLSELEAALGAPPLMRRGPGQREGVITPAGEALARRARELLEGWDRWVAATRDEVSREGEQVRIGALGGSSDLVVELLMEAKKKHPNTPMRLVELPAAELLEELGVGRIDLAFAAARAEGPPRGLRFETLGALEHAVIAGPGLARRLPAQASLVHLAALPLIVPRSGVLRADLERAFAQHPRGPFPFRPIAEVESMPRVVELVSRGLGAGVVSRFRLAFAPRRLVVRALVDGPPALQAGVYWRSSARLGAVARELLREARERFRRIAAPQR